MSPRGRAWRCGGNLFFDHKPEVTSVIVPVYNTAEFFLGEMLTSVTNQTYPHWKLCIADGDNVTPRKHKDINGL